MANLHFWGECKKTLEKDLTVEEYSTWIAPLLLEENNGSNPLSYSVLAPNKFISDWVEDNYGTTIKERLSAITSNTNLNLQFEIYVDYKERAPERIKNTEVFEKDNSQSPKKTNLIKEFTFDAFVEGKSNHIALAASKQIGEGLKNSYNPLFIYGGVGLGKTHLMHAVGNRLLQQDPRKKIAYVHSEKFVSDMVKSLQLGAISEFKQYYRSLDALLIDDIQFFAKKEQSQEELFHTFNSLLEKGSQMILTCDRYPKEIDGLEDRLKSRLGWGLPVVIEPPELETRVAILLEKAQAMNHEIDEECAFFIAQKVRSNVRELEGALKRVVANSNFTSRPISVSLIKDSLKDLLAIQARQVSVENIQKTTAEYYNIKLSDLLSKRRSRSVARPRQMAMFLAKELTNYSLPEIGESFGGRDHTTVIHACKKIKELRDFNLDIEEDYRKLLRVLTI
ncbi:MAG: chromosomal replication initiator protein DnaA [Gammaproteobacteria bacterium]|nr:chromosomal replication initiator protein DnaA [Gammaproteobacteria bacterium]HJL96373.1 chromosomal replication initiator protein DnaA [SAR86 cluster bacterium]HJM59367.1 chromosomal replication initiator protein DnaA [SAR86 cluster bacterium]|tara:strand:- start:5817 stop:7166 length:1350 start_codon:yes stop_codon:yes gene_type:complete